MRSLLPSPLAAAFVFITLLCTAVCVSVAQDITFEPLGVGPGPNDQSTATATNRDGSVVVGNQFIQSQSEFGTEAFEWKGGSITGLGALDDPDRKSSTASGVSADGTTIVGSSSSADGNRGVRWTNGTLVAFGTIYSGDGAQSSCDGISDNADWFVGQSISNIEIKKMDSIEMEVRTIDAVLWHNGSLTSLGSLGGNANYGSNATATCVSDDGSVVVGSSSTNDGPYTGFIWSGGSMQPLPPLSGATGSCAAKDMTPDGSTIVGWSSLPDDDSHYTLVAWRNGTAVDLGVPGGFNSSRDVRVSDDGNVIAGEYAADHGSMPFIWTSATGAVPIPTLLQSRATDAEGWSNLTVTDISGDGRVIVGQGTNPDGKTEAWRISVSVPAGFAGVEVPTDGLYEFGGTGASFALAGVGTRTRREHDVRLLGAEADTVYVERYDAAPTAHDGIASDQLLPVDWVASATDGFTFTSAEARFNLDSVGITVVDPADVRVWHRDVAGTGMFEQLQTSVDDATGAIVATGITSLGEFVLTGSIPSKVAARSHTSGTERLSVTGANPFASATTLELTLGAPSRVVIEARDILGHRAALLHDGPMATGTHRISFDADGLPSGVYLISATDGKGVIGSTTLALRH